jgi:radical SAM superfamily enzyme YgiQ (UPF0313 family)
MSRRATVTLIRPSSVVGRFALTLNVTPPISVAYLAGSLTAAGHRVHVIDAVGEAVDRLRPSDREGIFINGLSVEEIVARISADTELVGISCLFSHEWPFIRGLVRAIAVRFPAVPIVCGGEHATAEPEFSLRDAPELAACAVGEGEETVVDLAEAVASGRPLTEVAGLVVRTPSGPQRTAARARIREPDAIPAPRWDLVPIETYLERGFSFGVDRGRTMPLLATRGCPYQCTFCSSPKMWTTRYSTREPANVVAEMEEYVARYGAQNFDFYDLTAIVKREWIVEFCRLLLERRVNVTWQLPSGTRSEALDPETLRLMRQSGCRNVTYAPESGAPSTLQRIKKKVKLERMEASMRDAVEAGLNVKANIIVGFPGESRSEVLETLRFVFRMAQLGVHDVSVWTYSPYPGTELFEQLRREGRIAALDDDYFYGLLSYSDAANAVSWDEHFSAPELQRYRVSGMALFYAASWIRYPVRPAKSLVNVVRQRYESRMEMSMGNLLRRLKRTAGLEPSTETSAGRAA